MTGRQWRAESDRGQLNAGIKLLRPVILNLFSVCSQCSACSDRELLREFYAMGTVEGRQ